MHCLRLQHVHKEMDIYTNCKDFEGKNFGYVKILLYIYISDVLAFNIFTNYNDSHFLIVLNNACMDLSY